MNKKGLSILLALSMVFSLNTMAFAEEAVVAETEEAVVETSAAKDEVEVSQSQNEEDWAVSMGKLQKQTSFKDGSTISAGSSLKLVCGGVNVPGAFAEAQVAGYGDGRRHEEGSSPEYDDGYDDGYNQGWNDAVGDDDDTVYGIAFYNGKKLTPERLGGLWVETLDGKYSVPVKSIKLKGAKASSTETVQFSLKSIGSFKDIEVFGDEGWVTAKDAKTIYKTIKSNFKSAKNETFTAYIAPSFITGSISEAAVKTLKKADKTLSAGEIAKLVEGWEGWNGFGTDDQKALVFIKTKNGTPKKVQLVYVEQKVISKKQEGDVYKIKIKTKNLKKGTDYVIDGDGIKFNDSKTYTANGTIKAKT